VKLTREAKFLAWVAAALIVAAASFLIGSSLKPDQTPFYVFETAAEAYEAPATVAALSPAGFTGFGELDGSGSRTVVAGHVVEMNPTSLTLEAASGHRTVLRFRDQPRIARLENGSRELLRPGVTVMVKLEDGSDVATALLVVSQP
jgi:hypothetical protein